ncbi:MAG: hypothetical protein Q7V20_23095 [Aquabacterium sp.]|uniref:hypothetical protein n=1 Tax=Aquabacterium sp. TaxID=1872578 RepID=UPI002722D4B5|nr:hypothetical protein [Aquabacterium sp.]MDO9006341.1 hypothetical protein [Aquabacterium sp.]
MAIYPAKAAPFHCVICDRLGPPQWDNPARMTIAPVCYYCERNFGVTGGMAAARDDRLASQVRALAEAISGLAYRQMYDRSNAHGRA